MLLRNSTTRVAAIRDAEDPRKQPTRARQSCVVGIDIPIGERS